MKIGDVVTIIVDTPYGVEENYRVKNETGVVVDFEEDTEQWEIATGNPETDGWWFTEDELRPATAKEIEARLRFVLMERKVI